MIKLCVVTGTRAEYGLLYWLMKEIIDDIELQLQIIVTGSHLSPEFGLTYREIEKDGFQIDKKIEMLLSSDTSVGISKSVGLAQIGFADALFDLAPDLLIVLGDRYEIFAAVSAAMLANIPIAHLSGGEVTEGAYDDNLRHAITKMSHLHFTATQEYSRRVIQLGEQPSTVFNVGGMGIDNIKSLKLLSKSELEKRVGLSLDKPMFLVTFHPATLEDGNPEEQFKTLLSVLNEIENINLIFTKANADTNGRVINTLIDEFVSKNRKERVSFVSMGQLNYLSAMQYTDGVVGNSSSGIAEAPSFKVGTINIGKRQKGRIFAKSIINAKPDRISILEAVQTLFSQKFQESLKFVENPYGEGGAAVKVKDVIKVTNIQELTRKKFFDLSD
jgi:GDP/UDP-N,N'-diacetylbacillosamine 2-epimerase (hydrolysing)